MKRLQANRRLRRALPRELKDRMCPAEVEVRHGSSSSSSGCRQCPLVTLAT